SSRSPRSSAGKWTDGGGLAAEPLRRRRRARRRRPRLGGGRRVALATTAHRASHRGGCGVRRLHRNAGPARDARQRACAGRWAGAGLRGVASPGERRQLAWAIADVYDWEVDFTRDIRPGDRFTVLLERLDSPEGERRFGRILSARVDVARTPDYAFYFEDPDQSDGGGSRGVT